MLNHLTSIELYELGTGQLCKQMNQSFQIGSLCWTHDGKYLSVGSKNNQQFSMVWADKQTLENIWTLTDSLRKNKNFWKNYPINLRGQEIQNEVDSFAQQQKMNLFKTFQMNSSFDPNYQNMKVLT